MTQMKYPHVDADRQAECDSTDYARIRSILTDKFVSYQRAIDLQNHVEYLYTRPPQTRASGLVIMGEPGSGKTKIAHSIVRRAMADASARERNAVPVVMISMTGARDARTLFNRILEALGAPDSSRMRMADKEQLVLHLLEGAGTRLLIVDEIQDVLSSTTRRQRAALDTLKLIMNELGMTILCLGVKEAAQAMQCDPHLNARFDYKALPPWKQNQEFRSFLMSIERSQPLRKASDLASPKIMLPLMRKTKGNLAKIMRLLNHAAVFAVLSHEERITPILLDEAEVKVPPANILIPPPDVLDHLRETCDVE
jgi:hypothetical protein